MNLLAEDKLIWSPIVVNSRMNRERNASGINSYEQEFKFKPEKWLEEKIRESGKASWLDLCCGQGNALVQTAEYFHKSKQQELIKLKGIDLVDTFPILDKRLTCIEFETVSLVNWIPDQTYDLITCSHGLHYIGDKIKVIETSIQALHPQGWFVANLDLNNLVIQGDDTKAYLKTVFKKFGVLYNSRTKLLKQNGGNQICFNLKYLGANDTYGPNYTGQDSVTSHYSIGEKTVR